MNHKINEKNKRGVLNYFLGLKLLISINASDIDFRLSSQFIKKIHLVLLDLVYIFPTS